MKYESEGMVFKAEGLSVLDSPEQKSIEENFRQDVLDLLEEPEFKIGEGATAQIFYPKKGDDRVCYKIYHREAVAYAKNESDLPEEHRAIWNGKAEKEDIPWRNTGKREMEITDKVRAIAGDVAVPLMFIHHELKGEEEGEKYWVQDNVEVLVMQRLKDYVDLEQLVVRKLNLPEGFEPNAFADKLEVFFKNLHNLGIYHRDVAPRNIMVNMKTGQPAVIDFGRATDHVLSDENEYDQAVTINGKSTILRILSTDEKGVAGIREHLNNYAEYQKSVKK